MKSKEEERAEVKLAALQTVVQSNLSDGDKLFLVEIVNTYLPTKELYRAKEEIMQKLVETEMTWGEKLRYAGKIEGKTEGIAEGEWIGKHTMLLRLMTLIFGPLPADVEARVKTIKDDALLDTISRQMLVAKSLSEITLPPLPNQV